MNKIKSTIKKRIARAKEGLSKAELLKRKLRSGPSAYYLTNAGTVLFIKKELGQKRIDSQGWRELSVGEAQRRLGANSNLKKALKKI